MRFFPLFLVVLSFDLPAQDTFDSLTLVDSRIVYFDTDMHELRQDADSVLQLVTSFFLQQPGTRIHLTAHTDAVGSNQSNKALSGRRAASVREALSARGIPDSSLVIETFGETTPVAANDHEQGRQMNRRVTIDVYQPRLMRFIEGHIIDEVSGEGLRADIVLHGKTFRDSLTTNSEGKFRHPVPANEVAGIDAYAKGHFFQTKMFRATTGVVVDLSLPPAESGKTADIQNLYFVGNQAVLLPRSEPELPKVLRFLEINPFLKVEIAGHVNHPNRPPVGRDSWEWQLSIDRAKLVYDYLLDNNIDSSRVSFQGYGNTQMRFPKANSAQEQALNRRVEIRILENNTNN